jgi:uncharacterized damage-inducible protein DinB
MGSRAGRCFCCKKRAAASPTPTAGRASTAGAASPRTGTDTIRSSAYAADVPDLKPPRLVSDERETLHALLQYQRESLVRKFERVSDDAARHPLVPSGTTLLWLMKHMARAEALWIAHRFAGQDIAGDDDDTVRPDDLLAAAVDHYRTTWARVDAIVAVSGLDDVCRDTGDEAPVNLRWVLMHLLEETARHAGHADILRELVDGQTGR